MRVHDVDTDDIYNYKDSTIVTHEKERRMTMIHAHEVVVSMTHAQEVDVIIAQA